MIAWISLILERQKMQKEFAIDFIAHTAVELMKERSKEQLYQLTIEIKENHESLVAIMTPFQMPFPSIAVMSDDETVKVRVKSIVGNTVTLATVGKPGAIIVYLRVVDASVMGVKKLPV